MGGIRPYATITEMFIGVTDHFRGRTDRSALYHKVNKIWTGISYDELRGQVDAVAGGLAALGVVKGDRVTLLSENRPEWLVADMAMQTLGAVNNPLYPILPANQIDYIIQNAGAEVVIVSTQLQLNKLLKILPQLPAVRHIISMTPLADLRGLTELPDQLISWADLIERGKTFLAERPDHLAAARADVAPDDLCSLIYTSGTTGVPKGVMLTHKNIVSNTLAAAQVIPLSEADIVLSFLPLCHIFERMAGYYTMFAVGATIYYAESIESVSVNMTEVHPTIITTVPRLFERIYGLVMKNVEAGSPTKQKLFKWAVSVGKAYHAARREKGAPGLVLTMQHALADRLVFTKLRERVGGRLRFFVSGGAALSRDLAEFFEAAGILILEGYGLTETSPVLNINQPDRYRFGTVGQALPGVTHKIAPDGEILIQGPNIMSGYWKDEAATREVIAADGWFHTGDIGEIDKEGFLKITDRKKHLIKNSGGKYIAPQPIETLFTGSRYIDQCLVVGEKRAFTTALIVPDFDVLKTYAAEHKIAFNDPAELTTKPEIKKLFDAEVRSLGRDLAAHERVRKYYLVPEPFTIEGGDLTPTLKLKRKQILAQFAPQIDALYASLVDESV